nr:hypothetical protein [uncultured Oscillibacter sp.]
MKDQKKETVKKINRGAIVSGVGFALYLALLALGQEVAADIVNVLFAVVAVWTFLCAAELRGKDKEAVSYSLLWGTGALALMLGGCAVLMIRQRLGF